MEVERSDGMAAQSCTPCNAQRRPDRHGMMGASDVSLMYWYQGVNGLDFGRRDVGKRAEDRIADLVKKAMQTKISADSNRADFVLAA
jgi:hypothetical protein